MLWIVIDLSVQNPRVSYAWTQIPVFFLREPSGAVHVEDGEGLFFMSPGDAQAILRGLKAADGTKVKYALLYIPSFLYTQENAMCASVLFLSV